LLHCDRRPPLGGRTRLVTVIISSQSNPLHPELSMLSYTLLLNPGNSWRGTVLPLLCFFVCLLWCLLQQITHLDMHYLVVGINSQIYFIILSRFTSSFTWKSIFVIIATFVIHHSFVLSLQAQNLPFNKSFPPQLKLTLLPSVKKLTLLLYSLDGLRDNKTGMDLSHSSVSF